MTTSFLISMTQECSLNRDNNMVHHKNNYHFIPFEKFVINLMTSL